MIMCFYKCIFFVCSYYVWFMMFEVMIFCEVERRFLRGGMFEFDNDNENEIMNEIGGGFDK